MTCRSPTTGLVLFGLAGLLALAGPFASAADLSRLQSLLATTPEGGWVQVNTGTWSSAWPAGLDAVTAPGNNVRGVVTAWSSFAWDSANGSLLLWGGGHANYKGNEMYVWDATSGAWSLGSLPSRLDGSNFVVDNAAPQSSHTYDNNAYLPVNNMFVTFGGANWNAGGNFQTNIGGVVSRAGPWLWDPTKADATKVGGTTGSGYDTTALGGQMWTNRWSSVAGTQGPNYLEDTTAYRNENGKDVIYITADSQGSGLVGLYRYEFGDVRNGGTDLVQLVGTTGTQPSGLGAATIDLQHDLFVRTAQFSTNAAPDLVIWNLDLNNAANPNANRETAITLKLGDASHFGINGEFGIDYDSVNGRLLLWDGTDIWSTQAQYDTGGQLLTTWTVSLLGSTTTAKPNGTYSTGVQGKWHYVAELGAFIALDEYNTSTGDAGVWLYRPFDATAVPEAPVGLMWATGLLGLVTLRYRRSTQSAGGAY